MNIRLGVKNILRIRGSPRQSKAKLRQRFAIKNIAIERDEGGQ